MWSAVPEMTATNTRAVTQTAHVVCHDVITLEPVTADHCSVESGSVRSEEIGTKRVENRVDGNRETLSKQTVHRRGQLNDPFGNRSNVSVSLTS